jgi:hypothetical protein
MRFPYRTLAIAVSSFLFSFTQVMASPACPRWNGNYTCQYDGKGGFFPPKTFHMSIETIDERGATVYLANGEKVYPDGQSHHTDSLPILGEYANDIDYVATCAGGGKIDIQGEATAKKNGMRVQTTGYMQDRGDGRTVDVVFNVKAGFFNLNFNVPCLKK